MSNSARSIFVFGLYVAVLGIMLIVVPNFLLKAISRTSTTEVWIRVVGLLLLYLGFYYTQAARKEISAVQNNLNILRYPLKLLAFWTSFARFQNQVPIFFLN